MGLTLSAESAENDKDCCQTDQSDGRACQCGALWTSWSHRMLCIINAKGLASVLLHPTLLVCVAILLLDIALTKYHLWTFQPTTPQRKHFALITVASSGIDREMAFHLAAKSYSLVVAARNKDALTKGKTEIEALYASQVQVEICACDLSTSEGICKLIACVNENKLTVDILDNNAGASRTSEFLNLSDRQVDELLTLVSRSSERCCPLSWERSSRL